MESNYTLNDLSLHNGWVKKLLGLEEMNQKHKNEAELKREYEDEKWGVVLKNVVQNNVQCTIENVDNIAINKGAEVFSFYKDAFVKSTAGDMHEKYINLVYDYLKPYLPAPAIVELGSGYGTIILNLAKRFLPKEQLVIAGEFADSGVEMMKKIAEEEGLNFRAGHCNFYDLKLEHLDIPEGALIFTSYATTCLSKLPEHFLDAMIKAKPKAVIHFEPLFEQYGDDVYNLLRKKYALVNDYNTNLLSLVQNHAKIKTTYLSLPEIGVNPLLCVSVLSWEEK